MAQDLQEEGEQAAKREVFISLWNSLQRNTDDNTRKLSDQEKSDRFDTFLDTLEKEGFKINVRDKYKVTPLMMAVASGDKLIVSKLLENGADIDIKDRKGNTALDVARSKNNKDLEDMLVARRDSQFIKHLDNKDKGNKSNLLLQFKYLNNANPDSQDMIAFMKKHNPTKGSGASPSPGPGLVGSIKTPPAINSNEMNRS